MTQPDAAGREVPAEFEVARYGPAGMARIWSCAAHLAGTVRVLLGAAELGAVGVRAADPAVHGCKGHLEDWPAS